MPSPSRPEPPPRQRSGDLRVLSYNVRSLRDDRRSVAEVVRGCGPDVVCVQEAPRFARWRARCAALARDAGLVVVTGGRPAAGTLVLAGLRARVAHTEDVLLSPTPRLHRRGLAMAVLDLEGLRTVVASVHLGLRRAERARHVPEVLGHLERIGDRFGVDLWVLAGDVNEAAGGPTWDALTAHCADAYAQRPWGGRDTFPAHAPKRRIDAVLFRGEGATVQRCGVPWAPALTRASDHLPVLADLHPVSG